MINWGQFTNWFSSNEATQTFKSLSFIGSVAGGISSAIGARYRTKSLISQYGYQAQLAKIDQASANLAAESELLAGNRQIGALTRKVGQIKGAQRARLAASGVSLQSGSAQDILNSTDVMKELDKQNIFISAVGRAGAARMRGVASGSRATGYQTAADYLSPGRATVSSLLGSFGSIADSWYKLSAARSGTNYTGPTVTI